MFGSNKLKKDSEQERLNDKVDTIIGVGTTFTGNIEIKGSLRIDGRIEGKVSCAGDLVIGENGLVESEVHSRSVKIGGVLRGNVFAAGTVEISSTGKLYGDIAADKVVIADGAVFQGSCKMQGADNC